MSPLSGDPGDPVDVAGTAPKSARASSSAPTVLVTGASGYIGARLCAALRAAWPAARVVGSARRAGVGGSQLALDLFERQTVQARLAELRPDFVFHLAGVIHSADWSHLYRSNVESTLHLLQGLRSVGHGVRVVVAGSAAEYGLIDPASLPVSEDRMPNPVLPYGVTKAWQTTLTRAFRQHGLEVVMGRIFNVVGQGAPASTSLGAFAGQIKKMQTDGISVPIQVGNLSPRRDFVDIGDICRGLIALAERGHDGEVYNICSGASVSIEHALRRLLTLAGVSAEVQVDPERVRPVDVPDVYGSLAKVQAHTGWLPATPLDDSLRGMLS